MRKITAPSILTYNINISSLFSIVVRFFFISFFLLIFFCFFWTSYLLFIKIFLYQLFAYQVWSFLFSFFFVGFFFYKIYTEYKKSTSNNYYLKKKLNKKII